MRIADRHCRPAYFGTSLFIAASAASFLGIPIWQLIVPGPFDWHLARPSFWQGGIEALLLLALIGCGFALNRTGWLVALVVLPAALYLRRHAVDAVLLVDALYFELIVGLGMGLRRLLRMPPPNGSLHYVQAFVGGFALWSFCAWTSSALGFGSAKQLQWLTLLLAVPALFGGQRPLLLHLWRRVREQDFADRIGYGVLAAWMLVLFARSRVAIGFDALWYGLRGLYVLVPGHSVYEALGLVSPVHYFPKSYELFLLPLSAMRDYATIDAFSILVLLLLLLTCRVVLRNIKAPARAQAPLLALLATLPALANYATEPKPDLLATLLVVLAAVFGMRWLQSRSRSACLWMLACTALACSAKLTAIPYAGIMLAVVCADAGFGSRHTPASADAASELKFAWAVFALVAATAVFVCVRTLLLAGVPTIGPDPLFKLWLALGFALKEPAGTLAWAAPQEWADVPALMIDWLFRPQALPHIVITWTGNVWLWFGLVAAASAGAGLHRTRHSDSRAAWPLIALIATGLLLAICNRYMVRGGDGNYFQLAVAPAILLGGTTVFARLASVPRLMIVTLACCMAFAFFQASYSFISEAWTPGTRAFDADFSRSPRDTARKRRETAETFGIARISGYLAERPRDARVIGEVEPGVQFWLPARFEDLETIFFSRPEYTKDAASLRRFIGAQRIGYLTMPNSDTNDLRQAVPFGIDAAAQLASLPGVRRIADRRYYLLDVTGVEPDLLDAPDVGNGSPDTPR